MRGGYILFFPLLLSAFKHPKDRPCAIRAIFIFGSYIYKYRYINARSKIKMEIYLTFLIRFFQQQKGVFLCFVYY